MKKRVEDLVYPDVVRIDNQEEWNAIHARNVRINKYRADMKWYLFGADGDSAGCGQSEEEKAYTHTNAFGGEYNRLAFGDIIFDGKEVDRHVLNYDIW